MAGWAESAHGALTGFFGGRLLTPAAFLAPADLLAGFAGLPSAVFHVGEGTGTFAGDPSWRNLPGVGRDALTFAAVFSIAVDIAPPLAKFAGARAAGAAEGEACQLGTRQSQPELQQQAGRLRRTAHAERRTAEGRPTKLAVNDAQRAKQSDVFIQPNGRWIVRWGGREHVFLPDGTLHTSYWDRFTSNHQSLMEQGRRGAVTDEQFQRFKGFFK